MSDPHAKRWLADDPNFLASLSDLDQGLVDEGAADDGPDTRPIASPPPPAGAAELPAPPVAPSSVTGPTRPVARAPARPLDPARILNTAAPPRPLMPPSPEAPAASVAPSRTATFAAPALFLAPEAFVDAGDTAPAPPLAFTRPSAGPRVRRPLLDLFPPSLLQPEGPPQPALGTAVGPQLPPPRPRPAPAPEPDAPSQLDGLTYETFYGLREKPFSLSTDPRFLYQSASYERAARELLASLRQRSGPAVLTAPLGMGKTTLCRSLVQELDRRTVMSLMLEPLLSIDDVLKTMLVDFGVMSRDDLAGAALTTRQALASTLQSFLESLVPLQASAVVIIDEAQNLPVALLAEIGALVGAAGPEAQVLQFVLAGQPALTEVLKAGELQLLGVSVAHRTELGPLAADEIAGYVMHRLSIAGANTRIEFDEAAIARLYELSDGVPRLVNLLCDRAMTRGQQSSSAVIGGALVEAAAADLDLDAPDGDRPGLLASLLIGAGFALLVLAGAAGALWVSRDAVNRTILQWQNIPVAPGGPIRLLPVPLAPIPPPEIADLPTADTPPAVEDGDPQRIDVQ